MDRENRKVPKKKKRKKKCSGGLSEWLKDEISPEWDDISGKDLAKVCLLQFLNEPLVCAIDPIMWNSISDLDIK